MQPGEQFLHRAGGIAFPVKQEIDGAAFMFFPAFQFGLIFFFPTLLVKGKQIPLPAVDRRAEDDVQGGGKSGLGQFANFPFAGLYGCTRLLHYGGFLLA